MLEASGVVAKGRHFFVIFDNVRRIARIDREPRARVDAARVASGRKRKGEGYEDIAFSRHSAPLLPAHRGGEASDGTYKALIEECDEAARYLGRRWVDIAVREAEQRFRGTERRAVAPAELSARALRGEPVPQRPRRDESLAADASTCCRSSARSLEVRGAHQAARQRRRSKTIRRSPSADAESRSSPSRPRGSVARRASTRRLDDRRRRAGLYDFPRTKKGKPLELDRRGGSAGCRRTRSWWCPISAKPEGRQSVPEEGRVDHIFKAA